MVKIKFVSFKRTSILIQNRLSSIKTQISAFEDITALNAFQKTTIHFLMKETNTKYAEFKKKLDLLHSVDPEPSDYDAEAVVEIEGRISDLYVAIQGLVAANWPTLSVDLDSSDPNNSTQANLNIGNVSTTLKLPKINLPKYDGNINNWMTFYNLFDTLVHQNTSLSNVEKLQFLLSSLENEALNEVKSLPISNENYDIAWNKLTKRYHNKRRLISFHIGQIIDLYPISSVSVKTLRSFISEFNQHSQALIPLGTDVTKESPLLVSLMLRKFDADVRRRFENFRVSTSDTMPTITEFIKFLEDECSHMEAASLTHSCSLKGSPDHFNTPTKKHSGTQKSAHISTANKITLLSTTQNTVICSCCHKHDHNIYKCDKFHNMQVVDRFNFVKSRHHCVNCLGTSHTVKDCSSKHTCTHCGKKHHSLLHFKGSTGSDSTRKNSTNYNSGTCTTYAENNQTSASTMPEKDQGNFVGLSTQHGRTVVLATTLVKVISPNGQTAVVRGLLDSCAQASFISQHVCQLLQVKRLTLKDANINGLGASSVKPQGYTEIGIAALNGHCLTTSHPVIVLDKITSDLPRATLAPEIRNRMKNLVLADPTFDQPGPVDILLGADIFAKAHLGDKHHLGDDMPTAVNTVFGYVLMGTAFASDKCITSTPEQTAHLVTLLSTDDMTLHDSLQRFWLLEEPPHQTTLTKEEEDCESFFSSTISRDLTGRYITKLPFKNSTSLLGDSSYTAKRMFFALEKRLATQNELKTQYKEFIKDYLDSGHMKLCKLLPEQSEPHYYLPHHGVFKSGKIRVVFNASSPTSTNVSLNQILHQGQKLQNNILDIIFNFRRHAIVFACDIRQMFRQILVHPDDQKFQLIFWRDDSSLPLQTYQLTTVTYGMTSSPYLAIRTVQKLIEDEGTNHPLAATALKNQIYVDDILLGAQNLQEALDLQQDVVSLLGKGGFALRKWSSNHETLVRNVPEEHRETPLSFCPKDQPLFSILGIKWLPESDNFCYLVQLPSHDLTKRSVLSSVARIYDPCGWLSPLVLWAKALIQQLWLLKLGWDDPLPERLAKDWNTFLAELSVIEDIRIPRSLSMSSTSSVQILGFCDASESGFAACVYIKCESSHEDTNIRLLIGKTKVAPLKRISLPRLELCAAHLLSKLVHHCISLLSPHIEINDVVLWSDSTVTLSWIQTPPFRLKTYIANRVSQIQSLTYPMSWRHIKSQDNPADCASRGSLPKVLKNHPLWWYGPPWLQKPSVQWPVSHYDKIDQDNLPEVKSSALITLISSSTDFDILTKFSNWSTLQRTLAYIMRFIRNAKPDIKKSVVRQQELTIDELNAATAKICYLVQHQHFAEEISLLKTNKPCGNRLRRLTPFLDKDGLLRVGGRLRHSGLTEDAKHPIILPKTHTVTSLIIDHFHKKYLHVGPQILQSLISRQYWILSARSIIKSRVFKCITCYRCKPRFVTPLMGDLPANRLRPSRAFDTCGTDYAGPFMVKIHKLRRSQPIKVYLCLFICFTTKAVHIEVVTDLTSDAYIAALTRFVSRRGLPSHIYSDCGTNYIGAASQIERLIRDFLKDEATSRAITHFSTQNSIQFHFLPAKAPNFGGLWERAVKSVKHHLRRVIGEQMLTLEEFTTLSSRIEAILNSRPLTALSSDPAEIDVLTPGHFLVGSPLTSLPEPNHIDTPINRLRRWHMVQSFVQHIWKRWQMEYLHTLQVRSKWTTNHNILKEGDLVIIHEDNSAPLSWKLARITSLSPGKDGIPRVVHLKTKTGYLTRPASKVSVLPIY